MVAFPYDICRMCGTVSPITGVWALKLPFFVDLVQDLLQIKIKDTDKCSQVVCMQCVSKVKEFGLYAKQAKDLQKSIENYILFQEQEKDAIKCKVEVEDIIFIDEESEDISSILLSGNGNDISKLIAGSPPLVKKTPTKIMKTGPVCPKLPESTKEYAQSISTIVNQHGTTSLHSNIKNPKNSVKLLSNTHLFQSNMETPPTLIPGNKITVVTNENLFGPAVPQQTCSQQIPTKENSTIALSSFSPAFSTDLGGVGLFDTNCGKSRGVSDQNNGYRSSGSGYSNSSNKRNGGRKFKDRRICSGRRSKFSGGYNVGTEYQREFNGGGNYNQPRNKYDNDGYGEGHRDRFYNGGNFKARDVNY